MKRTLILLSLVVVAACGDDGDVSVERAWARPSPAATSLGAVYFDLTVADDDVLIAAEVPDSIADHAEIHEVVAADMTDDETDDSGDGSGSEGMDDGEMSGTDDGEMSGTEAMRMQELTGGLALSGGETVAFEPGGYHVMLIDLVEPLEIGDGIDLTLVFAEAGATTVAVEVRESAP